MYYIHKNVVPIDGMLYTLIPGPSHTGHEMIISLDADINTIVVGTVSQFVSLLVYRPSRESLDILARDTERRWCTSVKIASPNIILASDDTGSIYAMSRFQRFFCETLDILLYKGIVLGDICKDIQVQPMDDETQYMQILQQE
uniref:DNA damage-binding protein 1b n=1 Tax=Lygus hesperus TaxID=30085 RepID=A0A0A9Z6U9_LYGHE